MKKQFELELLTIDWLENTDEKEDLCAHGNVLVRIGSTILSDSKKGKWTVSAAALFLLRTITQNHTVAASVGDQLLPCCGFTMWPVAESDDVLVFGCPNGVDWTVEHIPEGVQLTPPGEESVVVSTVEYQEAVLQFADKVYAFYQSSEPKLLPTDPNDAAGYVAFWREWHRRYQQFSL
ncbi:hypothetical protein K3G63_02745 [Hymenobacter sp. HSC-4F20]|uniref:hypothetical protein n=1 Tax=Hymenobacter sp. HSC-4F20 TaxID=2864135 RepID=UPI001C72B0B1|nr:hypothetical protein [Hymenobacter sp. HSC-4F20]MBX0289337.1 hypothetical protein [Hymenobacter sp. HSC-4F20]